MHVFSCVTDFVLVFIMFIDFFIYCLKPFIMFFKIVTVVFAIELYEDEFLLKIFLNSHHIVSL